MPFGCGGVQAGGAHDLFEAELEAVGADGAGVDAVHLDAIRDPLFGQRFGEGEERCVHRTSDGEFTTRRPSSDSRDMDDGTARGFEVRPGGSGEADGSEEFEGETV